MFFDSRSTLTLKLGGEPANIGQALREPLSLVLALSGFEPLVEEIIKHRVLFWFTHGRQCVYVSCGSTSFTSLWHCGNESYSHLALPQKFLRFFLVSYLQRIPLTSHFLSLLSLFRALGGTLPFTSRVRTSWSTHMPTTAPNFCSLTCINLGPDLLPDSRPTC